jgi:hypothetical protein
MAHATTDSMTMGEAEAFRRGYAAAKAEAWEIADSCAPSDGLYYARQTELISGWLCGAAEIARKIAGMSLDDASVDHAEPR